MRSIVCVVSRLAASAALLLPSLGLAAPNARRGDKALGAPDMGAARMEVYKKVGDVSLSLAIFEPGDHSPDRPRAAIVFFFGGGWKGGSLTQFRPQAERLAARGMVAICANYRVASRHGVTAKACVEDAKSAIRWVRANAKRLGIDPDRIAAGGGSAGGHLAACTGVIRGFEAEDEDRSVRSTPDAMVLFNPACVLAPVDGTPVLDPERISDIEERMGVNPIECSPYHHVAPGQPPCIIFHGMADPTVPHKTAVWFSEAMQKAGNRCDLVSFEGQSHGFFNHGRGDNEFFEKTLKAADDFLVSLGFLPPVK